MANSQAFTEGYEAFLAGKSETSNPYDFDENDADHCRWNDGWIAAEEEGH